MSRIKKANHKNKCLHHISTDYFNGDIICNQLQPIKLTKKNIRFSWAKTKFTREPQVGIL